MSIKNHWFAIAYDVIDGEYDGNNFTVFIRADDETDARDKLEQSISLDLNQITNITVSPA